MIQREYVNWGKPEIESNYVEYQSTGIACFLFYKASVNHPNKSLLKGILSFQDFC